MESPSGIRRGRLLLFAYAFAAVHVLVIFTLGEPYPSLQGPLFAGHLQKNRIIYVPFYREAGNETNLPSSGKLLRHETLGIPAQRNFPQLVPSLPGAAAREFLIGHSLRRSSFRPAKTEDFSHVEWSAYKFHAPFNGPPELIGEEDIIHD
ncbi:MAG: hypothetical protein CMO35_11175 [Verrucomicrobiaceae bacterium]|nr:hypothetical protein [Verrucomicrobiaceae bacterium]MBB08317.1 hypothetical protein [Roseibacillus sp.]